MARTFMNNIDAFTEGMQKAWVLYKSTGANALRDEKFKKDFKIPNCKMDLYDESLFKLTEMPSKEVCISIRQTIADAEKNRRIRKIEEKSNKKDVIEDENTEITRDELIKQCIEILNATGEYEVYKINITVTKERV